MFARLCIASFLALISSSCLIKDDLGDDVREVRAAECLALLAREEELGPESSMTFDRKDPEIIVYSKKT